jgi:hypothetical protein
LTLQSEHGAHLTGTDVACGFDAQTKQVNGSGEIASPERDGGSEGDAAVVVPSGAVESGLFGFESVDEGFGFVVASEMTEDVAAEDHGAFVSSIGGGQESFARISDEDETGFKVVLHMGRDESFQGRCPGGGALVAERRGVAAVVLEHGLRPVEFTGLDL